MSRKSNITVIKIPTERPSFRPKQFPRMPILYLELLENKSKILPNLVNTEYTPKNLPPIIEEKKEDYSPSPSRSPSPTPSDDSRHSRDSRRSRESRHSVQSYRSDDRKSVESVESNKSESPSKNDNDDLSSRMKELLTSDEERKKDRERDKDRGKDRDRDKDRERGREEYKQSPDVEGMFPPKLSDIAGGNFVPKKVIENMDVSHDDEDLKRELLFKFELLRRSYKNTSIPEFTVHSDYKTMLRSYEGVVKQVNVDSNIENYKSYLVTGFYIVEYVLGYWLKFDMQDFTKQQILNMNKYEHLLIELGEKSYVPEGSKWPVEVRLLFTIVINAAIFIITKMVMKKVGSNLFGMMDAVAPQQQQEPKRKMRGPEINL